MSTSPWGTTELAAGFVDRTNVSLQPLVVVGMHRSGTSLAASLLKNAGLDIGDRLLDGNWSNPRGHFEDVDFFELQREMLVRLDRHPDGWLTSDLPDLPEDLVGRARVLLDQKQRSGRPWGWKDPRTVLFLPLWLSLLPAATFAIVYRAPWEVVESLYLRGDPAFVEDPELAVRVWLHYNRALLNLALTAPERCVLVNVETIAADPAAWVAAVAERSGLPLRAPDPAIYEPAILHGDPARDRAGLIFRHYPEVVELFGALQNVAFRPAGIEAPVLWDLSASETERRLAVGDWQRVCAHRRTLSQQRAESPLQTPELTAVRDQLELQTAELAAVRAELDQFKRLGSDPAAIDRAMEELREQLLATQRQVQAIRASFSWRLTAGVRAIARRLGRTTTT